MVGTSSDNTATGTSTMHSFLKIASGTVSALSLIAAAIMVPVQDLTLPGLVATATFALMAFVCIYLNNIEEV